MEAMIFDSHAHYDDGRFDSDQEELLGKILPEAGICGILNMGADLQGCLDTVALTKKYPYVYGAVGIHPEDAAEEALENLPELPPELFLTKPKDWVSLLRELLKLPKIVAVGEIGLDYHWLDACPKERQQEVFAVQLELANELSLPVAVHDREAHGDTLEFLKHYRPQGVLHCFSGSWEMAKEVLSLGMYLGLGGVVTFQNAKHVVEVAEKMPLDRLLLETDAPYMAPVPYRGRRNDSSLIRYVAEKIGKIRGAAPEVILEAAEENTRRLFRLPQRG